MKKHYAITGLVFLLCCNIIFAHCDTMDGPVVADARKALDQNNVNLVLKWIHPEFEKEATEAFRLAASVRGLNNDAKILADKYFFETIVRLHRTGEGVAYTGVKPAGTPIDEKIKAADRSIETGELSTLRKMVPSDKVAGLDERFAKVMSLKKFDANDVAAGREYVEAYVQFFHYAEGEESAEAHAHH